MHDGQHLFWGFFFQSDTTNLDRVTRSCRTIADHGHELWISYILSTIDLIGLFLTIQDSCLFMLTTRKRKMATSILANLFYICTETYQSFDSRPFSPRFHIII